MDQWIGKQNKPTWRLKKTVVSERQFIMEEIIMINYNGADNYDAKIDTLKIRLHQTVLTPLMFGRK